MEVFKLACGPDVFLVVASLHQKSNVCEPE